MDFNTDSIHHQGNEPALFQDLQYNDYGVASLPSPLDANTLVEANFQQCFTDGFFDPYEEVQQQTYFPTSLPFQVAPVDTVSDASLKTQNQNEPPFESKPQTRNPSSSSTSSSPLATASNPPISPPASPRKQKQKQKQKQQQPSTGIKRRRTRRKKAPLPPEIQEQKRQVFLEKNRQAARKCREKNRVRWETVQNNAVELEAENTVLHEICAILEREVVSLSGLLMALTTNESTCQGEICAAKRAAKSVSSRGNSRTSSFSDGISSVLPSALEKARPNKEANLSADSATPSADDADADTDDLPELDAVATNTTVSSHASGNSSPIKLINLDGSDQGTKSAELLMQEHATEMPLTADVDMFEWANLGQHRE